MNTRGNATAPVAGESAIRTVDVEQVSARMRARRSGHHGGIVWLTGLSGAGKSTIARRAESELFAAGFAVYVLDGDRLRQGVNADLGYSRDARRENVRRVAAIAAILADAGVVAIVALISPYAADRALSRELGGPRFYEVFVRAELATCERRDPRGLYRRARMGEIPGFTGISAPYEPPQAPDLVLDTDRLTAEEATVRLVEYVESNLRCHSGAAARHE
jgi:bifunctional enzyme CysN/CysC